MRYNELNLKLTILMLVFLNIIFSSCDKKEDNIEPVQSKGWNGLTDPDGNTYSSIIIGNQEWMVENLMTTKYNDGSAIINITESTLWSSTNEGAYCWYSNDPLFKSEYGALYNWNVIKSNKICPEGWHVPTIEDWQILINFLGDEMTAGGKLKENSTNFWNSPNTDATNTSGFTALPGGERYYHYGNFNNIGESGYWWSSTESGYEAYYTSLYFASSEITTQMTTDKRNGFSIRCIKD